MPRDAAHRFGSQDVAEPITALVVSHPIANIAGNFSGLLRACETLAKRLLRIFLQLKTETERLGPLIDVLQIETERHVKYAEISNLFLTKHYLFI